MADRLSIERFGDSRGHLYSTLLDNAFDRALALDTKLSGETLTMDGMSGRSYRMMVNNLVASMPSARYLEVGSWAGSTCCSAIEGNKVKAVCVDNWSQFGGPKEMFQQNVARCLSPLIDFSFHEADFRQLDFVKLGIFNIYLFDGPHEEQDHFDGLALPINALDEIFVFIVDDWNWPGVREGTLKAIKKNRLEQLFAIRIKTTQDNSHAATIRQDSDWHNGYYLSVLKKS